jgi:hypothetical protein
LFEGFDDEVRAVVANQTDRLNVRCDDVLYLPFAHSFQVDVEMRELRYDYGRQLYPCNGASRVRRMVRA